MMEDEFYDEFYISEEQYQIGEQNGINRKNVKQRVNTYGYDVDVAITKPLKRGIVFSNEEIEIMKKHKVTPVLARQRILALHWDRFEAMTQQIGVRRLKR